jgi:hypothetical protein
MACRSLSAVKRRSCEVTRLPRLPVSVAQDEADHYAKQKGNRKDGQESLFMLSDEMPHLTRTLVLGLGLYAD